MLPPDSIHAAMVNAAWKPDSERLVAVAASKLYPSTKAKAEAICARNSTTLSAFLRECVELLCKEYDSSHKEE